MCVCIIYSAPSPAAASIACCLYYYYPREEMSRFRQVCCYSRMYVRVTCVCWAGVKRERKRRTYREKYIRATRFHGRARGCARARERAPIDFSALSACTRGAGASSLSRVYNIMMARPVHSFATRISLHVYASYGTRQRSVLCIRVAVEWKV